MFLPPDGGLPQLPHQAGVITRQVSAENATGGKGESVSVGVRFRMIPFSSTANRLRIWDVGGSASFHLSACGPDGCSGRH